MRPRDIDDFCKNIRPKLKEVLKENGYDYLLKTVDKIYDNLNYLENTEKLIHNLQKERGLSVTYNESKEFKSELLNQRTISDDSFNNYIKFVNEFIKKDFSNLTLETKVKEIQDKFFELNNKRNEIEKLNLSNLEILNVYSKLNQQILETIYALKSVKD